MSLPKGMTAMLSIAHVTCTHYRVLLGIIETGFSSQSRWSVGQSVDIATFIRKLNGGPLILVIQFGKIAVVHHKSMIN